MLTGLIAWAALLAMVAVVWASRHLEINRALREHKPLASDSYDGPPGEAPRVSVIIAAKDEEENIETCVRSMLAQDYANFELIVVNDRSRDRTPQLLERLAEADDRLRVVTVSRLREGWFGKNNAMREGLALASGQWLCFGDADCRQTSTRTLSVAMRKALEERIDFLSVLPVLETASVWERIIQPVCGAIMMFWFHPKRVNDPRSSAAYANGAFMLMTRAAYERIGGHENVRTQVNEDMHMARAAKQAGLRLFVVQNRDLYRTRMYSSLPAIWRGWSRIFYGCFGTYRKLIVSLLVLLLVSVLPWVSMVAAWSVLAIRPSHAGWAWWAVAWAATLAVLLNQTVIWRYYRMTQTDPRLAPTYIVGALFGTGMLLNAMLKVGGRTTTTWRGTTYRGLQLEGPPPVAGWPADRLVRPKSEWLWNTPRRRSEGYAPAVGPKEQ